LRNAPLRPSHRAIELQLADRAKQWLVFDAALKKHEPGSHNSKASIRRVYRQRTAVRDGQRDGACTLAQSKRDFNKTP
jgi:hypothetical protein